MKYSTLIALSATLSLFAACGAVADDDDGGDDIDAGNVDIDADIEPDAEVGVLEAPADNDALAAPAEEHFLSITGERNFTYTDEVSFPGGDLQDFVQFNFPPNSNPNQVVRITLDCTITGQLDAQGSVRIFEDGVSTNNLVLCNEGEQTLTVNNTQIQVGQIELSVVAEASHMDYSLTVVGFQ